MVDFAKLLRERKQIRYHHSTGQQRVLLYHPESDSYLETTQAQWLIDLERGDHDICLCINVTDNPEHEQRYKEQLMRQTRPVLDGPNTNPDPDFPKPRIPSGAQRRPVPQQEPTNEDKDLPLHLKYRPRRLRDVAGQRAVTESLEDVLKSKTPNHAFLFTGPAGTGKTTLARILAAEFRCAPQNIMEIDAASNSGIDAMKEVTSTLRYHGFGEQPNKAVIIDECHALSKQAWDALLKSVEEPPPHVYFFFCTTGAGKVPQTISTRCASYSLKPLRYDDVMDVLDVVANKEDLNCSDAVMQLVAKASEGSMRQALVMLSMVRNVKDVEEAEQLLATVEESSEIIDLCRLLLDRKLTWARALEVVQSLGETNPESARIVITAYITKCLPNAKGEKETIRLLDILEVFSKPFNPTDKMAPLYIALGRLVFD